MKTLIFLLALVFAFPAFGQMVNKGSKISIQENATLSLPFDLRNEANGEVINQGKLIIKGHLENLSGWMRGGGIYRIQGDFRNLSNFQADTSIVVLEGSSSNLLSSGAPLYRIRIALDNGHILYLQGAATVLASLDFEADHTFVALEDASLLIGSMGQITGFDTNNFILTNGQGKLEKAGFSDFLFPVGNSQNTYTPLYLSEQDDVDLIGVRALDNAYVDGNMGAPLSQAISVSWEVMSDNPMAAVNARAQWNALDEPPSFNRDQSGIIFYDGAGWENAPSISSQAQGSDPYTQSRNNVAASGIYTVSSAMQQPPPSSAVEIPTMGQWAFFIFGLALFTLSVVVVWNIHITNVSRK